LLHMAGGEGGESEWSKALKDSEGEEAGTFAAEMKMRGLMLGKGNKENPKLTANENLLKWLTEEGDVYLSDQSAWGLAPHPMAISVLTVDETTNESTGRGMLARRAINEGDELLTIPLRLCMTIDASRLTFGEKIISNGLNEYLAIALHLIHEKFFMGDESFWKPYLDVLPEVEEVNPTFTWDDDDLSFMDGSPVVAATLSLKAKLEREYDAFLGGDGGLCELYPNRFPRDKFSLKNWQWAFTMLFSRAIRLRSLKAGECLALVPYADLINHSPFSGAYVDAREVGDWLFKDGTEEVILYSERGYRKMEQVHISYGPKSNAELLLLYGFALERNPYNSVDVTVSIKPLIADASSNMEDADPLAQEKIDFLKNVRRDNTVDFPVYADRYPIEMLEYLRLMLITPEDTRGKPISAFDYSRTISAANEASVLYSIVTAVKYQLTKYPNSEEDDAILIQDKALFRMFNYNQRMAIRHRRNEKRLLKRTISALEKQIRSRGLDREDLESAMGSTSGDVLPGDEKYYGAKPRSTLEKKLEEMGLPVDLR